MMKTHVFSRYLLLFPFLFALLFPTSCTPSRANTEDTSKYLDIVIPSFSLEDYDGKIIDSESYKGKYLVIHIATTWCPFCNAEAPSLEQIYQDYKDKGVEVDNQQLLFEG